MWHLRLKCIISFFIIKENRFIQKKKKKKKNHNIAIFLDQIKAILSKHKMLIFSFFIDLPVCHLNIIQ